MSERAWHRSIYWRIAIGFIVFLAVMLAVQGVLFLWVLARGDGTLPAHLVEFASVIGSDVANELEHNPNVDIERYVTRRYREMSRAVFVVLPDGRLFTNRPSARRDTVLARAREWQAKGGGAGIETLPLRFGRLIAFAPILIDGRPRGIVAVQPGGPSFRVLREIIPTMLIIAGLVMLGGTGLAALVVFRPVHRRLQAVEQAARRLGSGDLTARAPIGGGDEITAVAVAFNQMAGDLATRAEQLQASDRARRQLFADVSHELMTPLTAIRGYVETLALPELRADETTRLRYLAIVEEETLRLEAMIGDLLDLARLEAGGGALKCQEVRVADLFARVTARHERQSAEKQVVLSACVEPGAEWLRGDPDRLEQALQNLAANALRYTPAGGRIALHASPADRSVILEVRDSGRGIPAEHLPLIFDRFYKVDASRSASEAGSGLGLSIVKAIIERHGGTITVKSTPGVETVFELRLPAGAAAQSTEGGPWTGRRPPE